ncbi:MAG TPA: DUF4917 family protein [Thermoanaerobaculia bacterium]|nr:DUF4917 family protein [Thermoanaerobaculia bacterium]
MAAMSIYDWSQIADIFQEGLVLGNGASIAIDTCFTYNELLTAARVEGLITSELELVFHYLGTMDFELVLTMLWHAHHVNAALQITDSVTTKAYESLRAALIEIVRRHHVAYEVAEPHLPAIHAFLKRFKTVACLNYDLIPYWAIMLGNQQYGTWFKDAFLNGVFHENWRRFRAAYNASGATLVFYPHGNLALVSDLDGTEQKISLTERVGPALLWIGGLLHEIVKQWKLGIVRPLFVAEGLSSQKVAAISRSPYLRTVYDQILPELGDAVAVYGWAASDNDVHIAKQIVRGTSKLAFSVHRGLGDEGAQAYCLDVYTQMKKLRWNIEIWFYWADSPGVWLNP